MNTHQPHQPDTAAPIAIVGAGMAGLSCAQALAQAGHLVHVFDKSRGAAGRMSTRRGDDAGQNWQCDHGAQYFTARDAQFRAQVQAWQSAGVAAPWLGRMGYFDGQDFALHSRQALERWVGTPRMTAPAAHLVRSMQNLPQPVRFQWQTTIAPLEAQAPHSAGWVLHSPEHGREAAHYRALLLALPAAQAAPLLQAPSPAAASLARSLPMQPCWAVMVRCPEPVALPLDGCFVQHGPLAWIARDSSKPGRTNTSHTSNSSANNTSASTSCGETWLLHASPAWSQAHLEDDAQSVLSTLLAAFAQLGGPPPERVQASAHRWRFASSQGRDNSSETAPHTNHATGHGDAKAWHQGHWWDAQTGLGLCGDWLHSGTVEGAWHSGRNLARSVHATLTTG